MNLTDGKVTPNEKVNPKSRRAVFSVANTIEYCYECFIDQYKQDKKKALNRAFTKPLKEKSYTIWLLDIDDEFRASLMIRKPESIIEFKIITNDTTNTDECHFTIKTNMSDNLNNPLWVENIHCILWNGNQEEFIVTLKIKDLKSTKGLELPTYENGTNVYVKWRIDVFRFAAIYFTRYFTKYSRYPNIVYKMDPLKPSIMELLLVSVLKKKKIHPGDGISNFVCGRDLINIYNTYLDSYQHRPEPELPQAPTSELQTLNTQINTKRFICRAQLMIALNDAKILKDFILLPLWQFQFKYYTNILSVLSKQTVWAELDYTVLQKMSLKIEENSDKMDADVSQSGIIDLSDEIKTFFENTIPTNISHDERKALTKISKILRKPQTETIRENIDDNVGLKHLHHIIQVLYDMLKAVKLTDELKKNKDSLKGLLDHAVPKYIVKLNEIRQVNAVDVDIVSAIDNLDLFQNSLNEIIVNLNELLRLKDKKDQIGFTI
jgi:hypothetical protein